MIIESGKRYGTVKIPSSKSQAHRLLICAALGKNKTQLICDGYSKDIEATVNCLNALGAEIIRVSDDKISVTPIKEIPKELCHLYCGESGSTLRFLLPLVGAIGADAVFHMEGRLSSRPLAPLDSELVSHGMSLNLIENDLFCKGRLKSGEYNIPGNISSQYISGLLMALPLLNGDSIINVKGNLESSAYITMTESALKLSDIKFTKNNNTYKIDGNQKFMLPLISTVEGDYSNAAFFLCAGAFTEEGVNVYGLNYNSDQGDKEILRVLEKFGARVEVKEDYVSVKSGSLQGIVIDASEIPDLVPVISVVASVSDGVTTIINAQRLKLKESDRLSSTADMLNSIGADVKISDDGLVIKGKKLLCGGKVSTYNDHRIAMSAAVASIVCEKNIEIDDEKCVNKSYPRFWDDFHDLKGV